jgi:hypothetical protein
MITAKEKDEFVKSLCDTMRPGSHYTIQLVSEDELRLLRYLKDNYYLSYLAINHSNINIEIDNTLLDFNDSGGFQNIEKKKAESDQNEQLKIDILKLQKEEQEYKKKVRGLEEQLLSLNLIKAYWWFIGICLVIGGAIVEILHRL